MHKRFGVSVYKEAFNFCSAHFLLFPDGRREELHGHNYRVWVDIEGPLSPGDIVVDFMVLKPLVKRLCDAIDHRMLLPGASPFLTIERREGGVHVRHADGTFVFPERDVIVLPITNTSTERLAEYLCGQLRAALEGQIDSAAIDRIRVSVEESSGQCGFYEERR